MLFECSHPHLAQVYARSVPHPHASVMGNDIFRLGLIKSVTDFHVYSDEERLAGLDLAFYEDRDVYHTPRDAEAETTRGSVQHAGANYRALVFALADDADTVSGLHEVCGG